jgi:hypothetical protein
LHWQCKIWVRYAHASRADCIGGCLLRRL